MFCAISGVTPTEPVISPAGHLFEKSLVTKALKVRATYTRERVCEPKTECDRGDRVAPFSRTKGFPNECTIHHSFVFRQIHPSHPRVTRMNTGEPFPCSPLTSSLSLSFASSLRKPVNAR
jgi:hypothetical protein